jgi:hypothetical protein
MLNHLLLVVHLVLNQYELLSEHRNGREKRRLVWCWRERLGRV